MLSHFGLPRRVYFGDLDRMYGYYWHEDRKRVEPVGNMPGRFTWFHDVAALLAECLLVSPKIVFPVKRGQNQSLRLLYRGLGSQRLEQLLANQSFEFLCMPSYRSGTKSQPKVVDLERCFADALKGEDNLTPIDASRLVSLALASAIIVHPVPLTDEVITDYAERVYPETIFPPDIKDRLQDHCIQLARNDEWEAAYNVIPVSSIRNYVNTHDVDFFEAADISKTLRRVEEEHRLAAIKLDGVAQSLGEILRQENLPSVRDLILDKKLTLQRAADLRMRPEVGEFRSWLWGQPDPQNASIVKEAYQSVLLDHLEDNSSGIVSRAFRITSVSLAGSAIGTAVGALVAGPVGMAVGAVAGAGVSLVDGFAGDVFSKANPRRFASALRDELIAAEIRAAKDPSRLLFDKLIP